LAAAIKGEVDVESELVCGGGGIFDVVVDGDMIFSKHESDRFPEHEEILSKIRST
jgi:selenoprotein W-related protein